VNFRKYEELVNKALSFYILEYKLMERGEYLELFSIAIKPQHRGVGWGSAIIEDLIEFAQLKGYKGIQLQVDHKSKEKLTEYYSRFGFVPIDEELEDFMRIEFKGDL